MTRRAITLEGTGKTYEISKVTAVKQGPFLFHFDLLDDGTLRLIYNKSEIEDFTTIEGIAIIRED